MSYETALVRWEYEDELPKDITMQDYGWMFNMSSIIDGVRMFPYVEILIEGDVVHRIYLSR